jgi:putative membrane protein
MEWKREYPKILLGIYFVIWVWLAISPRYRAIWIDENILTVLFVGLLVFSYRKFRFSNTSYSLFFIFMVLHSIGGHYSYSENPLFDLLKDQYDLSRNYYDRLVHFLFGVLFFIPVYEILVRIFRVPKGWRALMLGFFVIASFKGLFELIEYGYVWVRADPLNVTNYLGEQGDAWDAQKDVFLGVLGAGVSWFLVGMKRIFRNAPTRI